MNIKSCSAVALLCFAPAPLLFADPAADESQIASPDRVRLEFREQPWPEVLRWLAEKSQLNLDWQELPEGTLNLTSTSEYSLAEAHDLINMQLLARGYTLLVGGEVLRVVSLENLDPTLVTRVEPKDLATLQRHQFVRVSFPLTWMIAEEAAAEFAPLLSPHGKLHPMASTNRLEAVDAVVNLRALERLLKQAEQDEGRREQVVEFRLEHRRAKEIAPKVRQLLGLPADESADPSLSQIDIEKTRFRAAALEQLGANAKPLMVDQPNINLVVNNEENSILVHARADKIAIARQAIVALDKPLPPQESPWEHASRVKTYGVLGFDVSTVTQLLETMQKEGKLDEKTRITHEAAYNRLVVLGTPDDHLTIATLLQKFTADSQEHAGRMETYEVKGFDATTVTQLLETMQQEGKLDKKTRITHEAAFNRLVVFGTSEDHLTIANLLQDFTAESRQAVVISLTSLDPHYAAKAVKTVLKNPERPAKIPGTASNGTFQIEPDATNSRLLLWATPEETSEVRQFLVQLGETFIDRALQQNIHVVQTRGASLAAIQGQLQAIWGKVSDTPLVIEPAPRTLFEKSPRDVTQPTDGNTEESTSPEEPTTNNNDQPSVKQNANRFIVLSQQQESDASANPPAVRLIESKDGRVVIASDDPRAAAAVRALVEGMLPPAGGVRLVKLEHAKADSVKTQLITMLDQSNETPDSTFTPAPQHSIDVDTRTNSLIFQNMTGDQLYLVEQMIDVLDQPVPEDSDLTREQRIYQVRFTEAEKLAASVKDVYRDLLSKSDKTFAANANHGSLGYAATPPGDSKTPQYQGLLSVSADAESNTLIVSAPSFLIDEVMDLVARLDKGPADSSIGVVQLSPGMDAKAIMEALGGVLKDE